MATKVVCDRCGKTLVYGVYGEKVYWVARLRVLKTTGATGSLHTYDLCDDCLGLLGKFIDGAEVVNERRDAHENNRLD